MKRWEKKIDGMKRTFVWTCNVVHTLAAAWSSADQISENSNRTMWPIITFYYLQKKCKFSMIFHWCDFYCEISLQTSACDSVVPSVINIIAWLHWLPMLDWLYCKIWTNLVNTKTAIAEFQCHSYPMQNFKSVFKAGCKICNIFTFYCFNCIFHFLDIVSICTNLRNGCVIFLVE